MTYGYHKTGMQTAKLEKALNACFLRAGLTAKDMQLGPIVRQDIGWQNPPLYTPEKLDSEPLMNFYEVELNISTESLYTFWTDNVDRLYVDPWNLVDAEGIYLGLTKVIYNATKGQHKLRFSIPDGFPDNISAYAGAEFTIECAALATLAGLPLTADENNFYVTYPDGRVLGIQNGKVLYSMFWTTDLSGTVQEMSYMPRGKLDFTCHFDQLAKLRSLLHVNRERFMDFTAVDYGLQLLRKLKQPGLPVKILHTFVDMTELEPQMRGLAKALQASLKILDNTELPDNRKIVMIYGELVPSFMTEGRFQYKIYRIKDNMPYAMRSTVMDRIRRALNEELVNLPVYLQN